MRLHNQDKGELIFIFKILKTEINITPGHIYFYSLTEKVRLTSNGHPSSYICTRPCLQAQGEYQGSAGGYMPS